MPRAEPHDFAAGTDPAIRGETAGEGVPIVLLHGLTATRRTIVHGSRRLERGGFRLITYDARGHGESDPASPGQGYGYPQLIEDLAAVIEAEVGEAPFLLGGHSMGAHTALGYALRHPERLSGLVVIGPSYSGSIEPGSLRYWNGLAEALEAQGVDGFVSYIDRAQGTDPAWRDSVLRFTRERLLRHRDLGAIAAALREVPASRPFGGLEELAQLELPTLVVASHDAADPGHPYAIAQAYAEHLPQARLVSEAEGESPLAWQGGRLSREIAEFATGLT